MYFNKNPMEDITSEIIATVYINKLKTQKQKDKAIKYFKEKYAFNI